MNEHSTGINTNKISEQNENNNERSFGIITNESSEQNGERNKEDFVDEGMIGC